MAFEVLKLIHRVTNDFASNKFVLSCVGIVSLAVCHTIALAISDNSIAAFSDFNKSLLARECEADSAFAFIPRGTYIRGSDRREKDYAYQISARAIAATQVGIDSAEQQLRRVGWFEKEKPHQTSYLAGFCLSRNLVTNQKYQEFVRTTNYHSPGIDEQSYQKQGFLVHPYAKVKDFLWDGDAYPVGTAQNPVVLISYQDALAYAEWKSQQSDFNYRLPSAEEWEKAARGVDGKYFPWGNYWQNDATNAASSGLDYTSAIAQFPLSKSEYGVEDMAGNVFEYTSSLTQNDSRAVMKGCSWDDLPGFCRAAYEHTRPVGSKHILFGFRLVKEAKR